MNPTKNNVLIIFIKAPRLGTVKTRLQPELSPEFSLKLYKAMGKDLVNHFSRSRHFDLIVQYWPGDALEEMRLWLGMNLNCIPQRGLDLGEKMKNSFSDSFKKNYQKVCIIGSDLPTLAETDILEALEKLDSSDAVLGPAMDGGYYLVALKKLHSKIFEDIDWSTDSVLEQTLLRVKRQNLSLYQMPLQRDIDTHADVMYLWNRILENDGSLNGAIPHTIATLKEIFIESK